jgi:hypothetical protein
MPNEAENEKRKNGFGSRLFTWAVVAFAFAALYVLSTGPVLRLCYKKGKPNSFLKPFCAPVVWACGQNRTAESIMEWYWKDVWHVYGPGG